LSSVAALRVAIIGAGLSGLACATTLAARGAQVAVIDKGRVPGGRLSTRASAFGSFDHGAQYFTVQHHRFEAAVQGWQSAGIAAPWAGRLLAYDQGRVSEKTLSATRFVGRGGMQAIARHLAAGLGCEQGRRVARIERRSGRWHLIDDAAQEVSVRGFDVLVLAMPSPQAAELAREHTPLARTMAAVEWAPCWAGMLALARPSQAPFDGAFLNDNPVLSWVARDSSKPERAPAPGVAERWVLHAGPQWSKGQLEVDAPEAEQQLLRAFAGQIERDLVPAHLAAHRWRFAAPVNPLKQDFLWDDDVKLGATGDWCNGPRVEGAYLSGLAMAEALLA
jgi:predicted NAD/FAD-dependent oxidoreductase